MYGSEGLLYNQVSVSSVVELKLALNAYSFKSGNRLPAVS